MTDDFDRAQEVERLTLEQALAAQKIRAESTPRMVPRGFCLNPKCCDEFEAGDDRLFCDGECANEWQRLKTNR